MHPFIIASVYGFLHAFEADHVLAVASLVSGKQKFKSALKDGFLWGVGHSFTIFIFGILAKLFSVTFSEALFTSFEAVVGLMLILIGAGRIWNYFKGNQEERVYGKKLAFSTGVIHGLAGSGSLILVLLPSTLSSASSIVSLSVFGVGCLLGMSLAAIVVFFAFSRSFHQRLSRTFLLISAWLCIGYGVVILIRNIYQVV